jgi:hypothetical protein
MTLQIRERLRALVRLPALPGWLLIILVNVHRLVQFWDEAEFAAEKARRYVVFDWFLSPSMLTVLGFAWLAFIVFRTDRNTTRLTTTQRLLGEAAKHLRSLPTTRPDTFEVAFRDSWQWLRVTQFVEAAFTHRIPPDLQAFISAEQKKWEASDKKFSVSNCTAQYLEKLAGRLTERDLDFGFHLPDTYSQFAESEKWPPNTR